LSEYSILSLDLISIVTPVYNTEKYIEETIKSVIAQTYIHWEMLIVDNGSTDASLAKAKEYAAKDNRIKVFEQTAKKGFPSYARNLAIKEAKGKYIAFLDSDDMWTADKLSLQMDYMARNPECNIICSAYEKVDKDGVSSSRIVIPRRLVGYKQLIKSNSIGNLTGMYNQEQLGKCFQKPIMHEDYFMWLTLLKGGEKAHGINNVTAKYRIHHRSVSSSKVKMMQAQWHIYRQELNLNLFYAAYCFICYTYFGLKKYLI
jgi:teichuronic acid biosynthesis glycosyltransferase TuaG